MDYICVRNVWIDFYNCSNPATEVALRNEEINRRRLQGGRSNGPLKITDPEAFNRMMAEMKRKAEEQKYGEDIDLWIVCSKICSG